MTVLSSAGVSTRAWTDANVCLRRYQLTRRIPLPHPSVNALLNRKPLFQYTMTFETGLRIINKGTAYSQGVIDHALVELSSIKEQLQSLSLLQSTLVIPQILYAELGVLQQHLLSLLDGLFDRRKAHETNEKIIEAELERGRERYDELPDMHLLQSNWTSRTLVMARQSILDERARLLEELRKMRTDYWKDTQEVKGEVSEVYSEFAEHVRKLEHLSRIPIPLPTLPSLFSFLDAPKPEEVYVPATPMSEGEFIREWFP